MTILAKIEKNEDVYIRIHFDLLKVGSISSFKIEGEQYYLLNAFQAAALQKLGVELGFYESSKPLYTQFPVVWERLKVTKIKKIKPHAKSCKELKQFVTKLEERLAQLED